MIRYILELSVFWNGKWEKLDNLLMSRAIPAFEDDTFFYIQFVFANTVIAAIKLTSENYATTRIYSVAPRWQNVNL